MKKRGGDPFRITGIGRGNTGLDFETHTLRALSVVSLCPGVSKILTTLLRHPGAVSRDTLLDALWNGRDDGPMPGIIGVYLCHARGALREAGSDLEIVNHFGRGWEIRPRPASGGGKDE